MKRILILFLFVGLASNAQFNKWAVGAEFGSHAVGDQSALITDSFNHFGAEIRYNLNEKVSLGLTGGYDNLTLQDLSGDVVETNYARISTEFFVDIFDILDLQNNTFTIIGHGGPGFSSIRNDRYDDNVFSATAGLKGLFKVTKKAAITLGYRVTANVTQDMTLDGFKAIENADINSTVSNFSLGLTFYPGKKNDGNEHGDWYVAPDPIYTYNEINNNYITKEYITKVVKSNCECEIVEFIFFDHDKHQIKEEGLNAITKIYTYLDNNPDAELYIRAFASATSSSNAYNKELASRRGNEVYNKLEGMGADMNKVSVSIIGKDFNWASEAIHDVARRVELVIIKK